jgi:signal transduction histidine kinase
LSVGAIASMIVLALAVLFANSYSTGLVTANARSLHSTNSLLGSSAILRAANNQAALFARSAALGTASAQARDVAIEEARLVLETFEEVADKVDIALVTEIPDLGEQIATLVTSSELALEAANRGEHITAFEILTTEYEPVWLEMRDELRITQAETVKRINDTETLAGWVGAATRFLAILLLPAITIIIYRKIVRTQVRERRLEFEAKLEYERKLSSSKDELLAGVSHQLRTPVTGIYGMSDLIADEKLDPETVQEFIGLIHTEAYDLDRMVADLLTASRLDAGAVAYKEEAFPITEIVERVVGPARKTGMEVTADVDAPVTAVGDPDRVVHIIRNLLSNAHKHGGPGIRVTAQSFKGRVEVVVDDEGTETLDEAGLFRDFANGGIGALTAGSVGLGLSVARRLAKGMSGDLAYQRANGLNRFVLTLPGVVDEPIPELVQSRTA